MELSTVEGLFQGVGVDRLFGIGQPSDQLMLSRSASVKNCDGCFSLELMGGQSSIIYRLLLVAVRGEEDGESSSSSEEWDATEDEMDDFAGVATTSHESR